MKRHSIPLTCRQISKFIFDEEGGKRLSRFAVRNELWSKTGLKDLTIYNSDDYTYILKDNYSDIIEGINYNRKPFSIQHMLKRDPHLRDAVWDYSLNGTDVTINRYSEDITVEVILAALTMVELEGIDNPEVGRIIRKIKRYVGDQI